MVLSGQLKDYALPELLTTIEQGGKTGMLTIRAFNESANEFKKTYLSFKNGYLIAVSEDSMSRDLVRLMDSNKFLDYSTIDSLITLEEEFQLHLPVGSYLQANNQINELQLKKLFDVQVVERAVRLYALPDAWFTFNSRVRASMLELTGLQLKANTLNLLGLRALQNWDHLLDRLPEGSFALIKNPQMSMEVSLSALMPDNANDFSNDLHLLEEKVLQHSDGKTSLSEIAAKLNLSLLEIQKVAFQLIFAGYVDELPMVAANPVSAPSIITAPVVVTAELKSNPNVSVNPNPPVNSSFLQNLSSFLKGKTLTKV